MKLEIWTTAFNPDGEVIFSGYSDVVPRVGEWVAEDRSSLLVTSVIYVIEEDSLAARVVAE